MEQLASNEGLNLPGPRRLAGQFSGKGAGLYHTLGFVKKTEVPMGEARWLTIVAPDDPDGTELLLKPDVHPAVRPFKRALAEDGILFTSFAVKDVQAEYERLRSAGVHFTQPPVDMGGP